MNILLIGYGKMGKEIEQKAISLNHNILGVIDNISDWENTNIPFDKIDIAIEFSTPTSVKNNILKCFSKNIPILVGTTSWQDSFDEISTLCKEQKQTLLYSSNFSLGVNIFFEINRKLATLMKDYNEYSALIKEVHHIEKKDKPSGTAISIKNDLDNILNSNIEIISKRIEGEMGTHKVSYKSNIDTIKIKHKANNREGFATGALVAAKWLIGKKGIFTMTDVLKF